MAETAGRPQPYRGSGRDRDLSAIVRSGLSGGCEPDEVAVPGSALYAVSPLTGQTGGGRAGGPVRPHQDHRRTAPAPRWRFVDEYARLLLPPVLGLATRHGIGLEAHLQNCVPTFVDGVPHRLAVRDLAGMRVYPARLGCARRDRAVARAR